MNSLRLSSSVAKRRETLRLVRLSSSSYSFPSINQVPSSFNGSFRSFSNLSFSPLSAAKKRKILEKGRKMREGMENLNTEKQLFIKNHTRKWIRNFLIENNLCPFLFSSYSKKKIRFFIDFSDKKNTKNLLKNFLLVKKSYTQLKDEEVVLIIYPNLKNFEDYLDTFYHFEDFLFFLQGEGEDEAEVEAEKRLRDTMTAEEEEVLIQKTLTDKAYTKKDAKIDEEFDKEIQISSFHPQFAFENEGSDSPSVYANRSPYPMIQLLKCGQVKRMINAYSSSASLPAKETVTQAQCPLSAYFKSTNKEIFFNKDGFFQHFLSVHDQVYDNDVDADNQVEMLNDNLVEFIHPSSSSMVSREDVKRMSKKFTSDSIEEKFNELYEKFNHELEQQPEQPDADPEQDGEEGERESESETVNDIDNIWKNNSRKLELLGLRRIAEINSAILADCKREQRSF